jgi:hypothetical protein
MDEEGRTLLIVLRRNGGKRRGVPSSCCRVEIRWREGVGPFLVALKHGKSVGRASTLPIPAAIGSESTYKVKEMEGTPFMPTLGLPSTSSPAVASRLWGVVVVVVVVGCHIINDHTV